MSYDYWARPDVGWVLMTIWYAIVFAIMLCDKMVICLYDYIVVWLCVYWAGLDAGRSPITGTYASVYDHFMC